MYSTIEHYQSNISLKICRPWSWFIALSNVPSFMSACKLVLEANFKKDAHIQTKNINFTT